MLVKIVRTTDQMENAVEMIYADEKKTFLTYCYRHIKRAAGAKITSHKVPEMLKSFKIKDGSYYRLRVEKPFCLLLIKLRPSVDLPWKLHF